MIFYVLNNVPTIDAATGEEAAREYALQNNIVGGIITLAVNTKVYDLTPTPADIKAVQR